MALAVDPDFAASRRYAEFYKKTHQSNSDDKEDDDVEMANVVAKPPHPLLLDIDNLVVPEP